MFKRAVVAISAFFILFTLHFPAGAAAAGGAIVFSEVTLHHPSGPDGEPMSSPSTGGLFAFENGRVKQLTTDPADREPSFSPDGSRIVFVRKGDVWTVRPGGFGLRQLTTGADLDSHPQVAPNGRYVLFERRLSQHPGHDLYTSDLEGGVIRPLAATAGDEHEASFFPDGRQIAYVRKDGGGKNHIWSVRPSGGGPRPLTRTASANDFSPHFLGQTIVFSRGAKRRVSDATAAIYSMDRRGRHLTEQVARGRWVRLEGVSPASRTILFGRAGGLWVKPIGGSGRRIVDFPKRRSITGIFSPDGRRIAALDSGPWDESLVTLDSATGHRTQTVRVTLNLEGSEQPSILGSVLTWQPTHRRR